MAEGGGPFASGSVGLGLHLPPGHSAPVMMTALAEQGRAAEAAGFGGASLSEHHRAFPGYVAQPMVAVSMLLARTERIWAAACPTLLSLWNPVLLAEQLAWTAAVHPGRVGLGVAAGYHRADFEAVGVDFERRVARFDDALCDLTAALSADGPIWNDPAVLAWRDRPAPLLCAAKSATAGRRAARHGLGVLVSGHAPVEDLVRTVDAYRDAGGTGPVVAVCRVWSGDPPVTAQRELDRAYASAGGSGSPSGADGRPSLVAGSAEYLVDHLCTDASAFGLTGFNLRVHLPRVRPPALLDQIAAVGALLPRLRAALPDPAPVPVPEEMPQ